MKLQRTWVDRAIGAVSPSWELQRLRARVARDVMQRHYEGAATGRRTQGWHRSSSDANMAAGPYLGRLRDAARDLVRNNPFAESALSTIVNHTVGWGILAKPKPADPAALSLWQAWAESTECDADGTNDIYGLQKLAMRTIVESGEVLVRRRMRRPTDGLALPMQLQILEPDFIDTAKDSLVTNTGGARVIQGVEFDALGRRIAYWLFREHPGSAFATATSVRVPASEILHIFKPMRPGQVRGASWFAPVLLRFKDFDEFEDATLMKQKIAAMLCVLTTDPTGSGAAIGELDNPGNADGGTLIDGLYPGMISNLPPGRDVKIVEPPSVREYADYCRTSLRAIATGMGVPYECLTGDYANMPFSAARASRIEHWHHVEDWRWRLLIPQFCDPIWAWTMEVAAITRNVGALRGDAVQLPGVEWTAPPAPLVDPVNEGLAIMRNVRAGIQTLSDALRERGYDPAAVLQEYADDFRRLDELKLIFDSDPRQMTQAGQLQGKALPKEPAAAPASPAVAADDDSIDRVARRLRLASGERA